MAVDNSDDKPQKTSGSVVFLLSNKHHKKVIQINAILN